MKFVLVVERVESRVVQYVVEANTPYEAEEKWVEGNVGKPSTFGIPYESEQVIDIMEA